MFKNNVYYVLTMYRIYSLHGNCIQ